MILISKDQMNELAILGNENFIHEIFEYLNDSYSELLIDLSMETIKNRIRKYVNFAIKYEFSFEYYVVEFVILCFKYNFLQSTPYPDDIEEILTYPDRDDDFKLAILQEHLLIRKEQNSNESVNNYELDLIV